MPIKCKPGLKPCGKRCFPMNYKCADEKQNRSRSNIFNPTNLAILGVGATVFGGLTFAIVQHTRGKESHRLKTYTKPIPPSAATMAAARQPVDPTNKVVPAPPEIPLHKRVATSPDLASRDERELSPLERKTKAISWAQSAVSNGQNTWVIDFETNGLIDGVNPMLDPAPQLENTFKQSVSSNKADKYIMGAKPPGVVQIAMHRLDGGETYNIILDPEELISPSASRVHGLTQADVKGQPTFKDIYPFLKEKLEGKDLIAFNARFDTQLLDMLCQDNGLERINLTNRNVASGLVDNDGDAMHQFALFMGRQPRKRDNLAGAQLPRRVDMELQMRKASSSEYDPYANLPKVDGVRFGEAHDALEDVFSLTELIYRMAANHPIKDRLSRPWQLKKGNNPNYE